MLRICLRYHTLGQLEDGYGISIAPPEQLLARQQYGDDPAERFAARASGFRTPWPLPA